MATTDTLEWVLKLVDRVSGPASGIVSSLDRIKKASSDLRTVGGAALAPFAWGLDMITTAAQVAAVAVVGLVVAGTKMALDAASFKDDMLRSFELITGSRQAALQTYEAIEAISDKTPFKTNDVMGIFKTLLASGFGQADAENIFAAISDVAAVQGAAGGERLQELSTLVAKISATDKLTGRELLALASSGSQAGVGPKQLIETIANQRKISTDQAMKLIENDSIKGNEAISLILDTVKQNVDKGGPLGQATILFGQASLSGALSTFKSRIDQLFQDVNIEPVKGLLTDLNAALAKGSVAGDALRSVFNDLFGSVLTEGSGLVKSIFTVENITKFGDAIKSAMDFGKDFFAELKLGWDALQEPLDALKFALGGLFGDSEQSAGKTFADVLYSVATAAVYTGLFFIALWDVIVGIGKVILVVFALIGNAVLTVVAVFGTMAAAIALPFVALVSVLTGHGLSLVDGLWDGIKRGWARLIQNFKDIVQLLPDTVKKALGIASPSKVMMQLGMYTAEGFGLGLDKGGADIKAPEALSLAGLTSGGGSIGSAASNGNHYSIEINVNASGSMSKDDADDLAVRVRREVESLFDLTATQAGAAA